MSTAILTLSENGHLQGIHNKWLSKKACSPHNFDEDSDQLSLESFWGLFGICGIVCFAALSAFFCKVRRQYGVQLPEPSEEPSRSSRSQRVVRFMEFMDEREKESSKRPKRKRNDMSAGRSNGNVSTEDEARNHRTKRRESDGICDVQTWVP